MALSPRRRARSLASGLCALLLIASAAPARADVSAADRDAARTLMEEGVARRARGDMGGALERFVAADSIMRVPTTGLEVARTLAALGRVVEARSALRKLLEVPVTTGEPRPFADARADAAALLDTVQRRVARLRIELADADAQATLDGAPVAHGVSGDVDPGEHRIVVARGNDRRETRVTLGDGEEKTIRVEPLDHAPRVDAPEAPAPGAPVPLGVYLGLGATGVLAGAATVTGLVAMGAADQARLTCRENRCPPPAHGDVDRANTFAAVSTVTFVVAGAALAATAAYFFLARRAPPATGHAAPGAWAFPVVAAF